VNHAAPDTSLDAGALSTPDLLIAGMSYMAPGFSLFFTVAVVAGFAGIHMPGIYVLAGLGVLCTGSTLGAFARLAPGAGALQLFVERGFGRNAGAAAGVVLAGGYLFLQGAVSVLFGGWTAALIRRHAGLDLPWPVLAALGTAGCGWLTIRGVGLSIRATWALFLFEFVLILAVAIATLVRGGAAGLDPTPLLPIATDGPGLSAAALAMVYATFSFVGFEGAISFAEETPDPARAMPVAVVGGIGVIAVLYVLTTYAVVVGFGVDRIGEAAKAPEPLSVLAATYAGPLGALLDLAVWTSVVANLMAGGNANARLLFAMARSGILPAALARIHPRYRTPAPAIVAFMAATLAPTLISAVAGDYLAAFGILSGFGALLAILVYMAATVAFPVHLHRTGHGLAARPFSRVLVPIAGVAIWLVPIWGAAQPGQDFPYRYFPWAAAVVLVAATCWSLLGRLREAAPDSREPV
jgi:amino acid transporter